MPSQNFQKASENACDIFVTFLQIFMCSFKRITNLGFTYNIYHYCVVHLRLNMLINPNAYKKHVISKCNVIYSFTYG